MTATLILENGAMFRGTAMGDPTERVCEMVFNTSMAGYQEVLTDPSYAGQGIVMTYPLIGNYGVNQEDEESSHPGRKRLLSGVCAVAAAISAARETWTLI